ncbi:class I and II aminotransferase [Deinococcus phoenicis]|uniref:cysteine-S-conjugate beta-lyase n=1 Tax=Deinococcus phoenicis TaxID=1476583 RepID=A0A016QPY3_9DEIO|nr:aminotransferase class I/II-fold pyridoxal phosphate-dependent enzyme [Deinococcus phoenicis]EYB67952.1 class I and II aminotransferase [Deinococcus phoenicis]
MTTPDLPELTPSAPSAAPNAADVYGTLDPAALAHVDSLKWTRYGEGVIPLWIADMDYPVAPPILAALQERLTRGLGYYPLSDAAALNVNLREKLAGQGLTDLPGDGLSFLPGVVPGLYAAVAALTAPGEPVLTMTPIYHPFHLSITDQGRRVAAAPLREGGEGGTARWDIDWDALDAAARGTRLLLLCHPHNPTGRVWNADELARLRDFVLERDLYVVSDELHADLRYTGAPFEAFAADPRVRERTLTLTGPCKAYNTAGLGIGVMVGHDPALVKRVRGAAGGLMGHPSTLSVTMWQAALGEGGPWLAQTLAYLRGNRDVLHAFLAAHLPWVRATLPEATYLAWLDLRAHPRAGDIQNFLLEEARIAIHDGPLFAPDELKGRYQGFIRLNFATSRTLLIEALERMADALGSEVQAQV